MLHRLCPWTSTILGLVVFPICAAAMSVTVTPLIDPPVPVGTMVTWAATVSDASDGTLCYRFRVRPFGGDFRLIRDFGPQSYIDWTATEHEGLYEMEVSVRNRRTGETQVNSVGYEMLSRVSAGVPVITATDNPLVFLYSAPTCSDGDRMRVQFQQVTGTAQNTPPKPCQSGWSMNFYIAGLLPNTAYTARHIVETGAQPLIGPDLAFGTADSGAPPALFSQSVLEQPRLTPSGILLASSFVAPAATDLNGNLIWYATNGVSFITNADPGGYFWSIIETPATDPSMQVIRKFDLAGMTVLETNAARVNEQLAALGARQISGFHHDVKTLSDGRIVALATVEQILTDVQGPGRVDVLGDMIIVLRWRPERGLDLGYL